MTSDRWRQITELGSRRRWVSAIYAIGWIMRSKLDRKRSLLSGCQSLPIPRQDTLCVASLLRGYRLRLCCWKCCFRGLPSQKTCNACGICDVARASSHPVLLQQSNPHKNVSLGSKSRINSRPSVPYLHTLTWPEREGDRDRDRDISLFCKIIKIVHT